MKAPERIASAGTMGREGATGRTAIISAHSDPGTYQVCVRVLGIDMILPLFLLLSLWMAVLLVRTFFQITHGTDQTFYLYELKILQFFKNDKIKPFREVNNRCMPLPGIRNINPKQFPKPTWHGRLPALLGAHTLLSPQ